MSSDRGRKAGSDLCLDHNKRKFARVNIFLSIHERA